MWLLSTDRAELHEFASPEDVTAGYAILSHVWDEKEQTFQYTRWLQKTCEEFRANPRDYSYPKIRKACILAELHGYKWLWVDTSCIDKTSSTDLSEAINSMYRYYSLAEICYAYLRDVRPGPAHTLHRGSDFYRSEWHKRGWTLQELIAPLYVLFLARDWTYIGTKAELADRLEVITRVPAPLLRKETPITHYSIAQRMSWAASRVTKRPEDRTYSLLGIFGINMPTLYGEGRQAFYRLQEEIMKRFEDTTLFAWGHRSSSVQSAFLLGPSGSHTNTDGPYLLAPDPSVFYCSRDITFEPLPILAMDSSGKTQLPSDDEHLGVPSFSITPYGVLAHTTVIKDWEDSPVLIAHLFWSDSHGASLGLRLKPSSGTVDPEHPRYDVAEQRLVLLRRDEQGRFMDHQNRPFRSNWRNFYITHRAPPELIVPENLSNIYPPINLGSYSPFRISHDILRSSPHASSPIVKLCASTFTQHPWLGNPAVILQFAIQTPLSRYRITPLKYAMLHLGVCESGYLPPMHWACMQITERTMEQYTRLHKDKPYDHDCHRDHIYTWPGYARTFHSEDTDDPNEQDKKTSAIKLELSFHRCPISPQTTLVASITKLTEQTPPMSPVDSSMLSPVVRFAESPNMMELGPRFSIPPVETPTIAILSHVAATPLVPHDETPRPEGLLAVHQWRGSTNAIKNPVIPPTIAEFDMTVEMPTRPEVKRRPEAPAGSPDAAGVSRTRVRPSAVRDGDAKTLQRDEHGAGGPRQGDSDDSSDPRRDSHEEGRPIPRGAITPQEEPSQDEIRVRRDEALNAQKLSRLKSLLLGLRLWQ